LIVVDAVLNDFAAAEEQELGKLHVERGSGRLQFPQRGAVRRLEAATKRALNGEPFTS
jgi:hypothetical protein